MVHLVGSLTRSHLKTLEDKYFPFAGFTLQDVTVGDCTQPVPPASALVIAIGEDAWNHTQGRKDLKLHDWRGHIGPSKYAGCVVYGVMHPDDLGPKGNPRMVLPSKCDWQKVPEILAGKWPQPLTERLIATDPIDVLEWFRRAREKASYIVLDTEYTFNEDAKTEAERAQLNHITMISVAYPEMDRGIQLIFMGDDTSSAQTKAVFIKEFDVLLQIKRQLYHNACADLRAMETTWGFDPTKLHGRYDDTMLAHHAMYSELEHTLEFLESIWGRHHKMKHLPTTDPLRNWGDTLTTMYSWEALRRELEADRGSQGIYEGQSLKLIPIKYRRESLGLKVNQQRVLPAIRDYAEKQHCATRLAHAYCGWPLNLGSAAHLGYWLYDVEGHPVQRHKKTKQRTTNGDAIAILRTKVLPFDADWESNHSVTVEYCEQRVSEGAHPLLEASVLNAEASQALKTYLWPLVIGGHVED